MPASSGFATSSRNQIFHRIDPNQFQPLPAGPRGTEASRLELGIPAYAELLLYLISVGRGYAASLPRVYTRAFVYTENVKVVIWLPIGADMIFEKPMKRARACGRRVHLRDRGFTVCCFPVKVERASAGWIRAVAIIDGPRLRSQRHFCGQEGKARLGTNCLPARRQWRPWMGLCAALMHIVGCYGTRVRGARMNGGFDGQSHHKSGC
jgi:hypothetical protein